MAAFVRVSGPPNGNFLVGYPGISATLVSDILYIYLEQVDYATGVYWAGIFFFFFSLNMALC